MNRRGFLTLAAAGAVFAAARPARAAAGLLLALDGPRVQGGLLRGRAAQGATVRLDGHRLDVSAQGLFLAGFGRDAAPHALLELRGPEGRVERHPLAIAKRDFPIQRINGLPETLVSPKPEVVARIEDEIRRIEAIRRIDTPRPWFADGLVWPVTGIITGVFGAQRILDGQPRQPHNGVDVAAPAGTPVKAAADGVIRLVAPDMVLTGGTVVIDHGFGLSTLYAHLEKIAVEVKAPVRQGQVIGHVGESGRATGPNLHWGLNWFETGLDPALAAGPMPKA